MKYPLIARWIPNLPIHHNEMIDADDLERELEKAVVVLSEGEKPSSFNVWIERPNNHSALKSEALLIGQRPLRQPRTKTLSEDDIRATFYGCHPDINAMIDKLFGKE